MEVGEWEVSRAGGCHLVLAICGLRGEQWATVRLMRRMNIILAKAMLAEEEMRRMKTRLLEDLHCPPLRPIHPVTTPLKMLIGAV